MEVVKQITAEQLETIRNQQRDLNSILTNIGVLESQKHGYLHSLADLNKIIEETKVELENQYGAVNINLETGDCIPLDAPSE
jgi:hypothetical protein